MLVVAINDKWFLSTFHLTYLLAIVDSDNLLYNGQRKKRKFPSNLYRVGVCIVFEVQFKSSVVSFNIERKSEKRKDENEI